MKSETGQGQHIVVVGAGYAGLATAGRVARRTRSARVTLVNASPHFVERVRLHQVAANQRPREHALADLVRGTGIQLVVGRVTALDAGRRELWVDTLGEPLGYDALVYALGSVADTSGAAGVAEHAYTVAGVDGARALRDRAGALAADGGAVAVVGGGLTGIETATELAETYSGLRVRLLSGTEPGADLSPRGRAHLRRAFGRLGVEVHADAAVEEVTEGKVVLTGGRAVAADLTVWAAGFTVPALAAEAGLAVDGSGRIVVDGTMRSVSHPEVYAVGDSAAAHRPDGRELRMSCATGLPVGQYAADALVARLAGREPGPFRFRYLIRCISLGRHDGVIQFVDPADRPHRTVLTGGTAARVKEAVVRGARMTAARSGPYLPARRY
ncbi:NAD(P)/FAD-dependent oxidoreductase [Qaidamihabitans albus]|uniref:NAD(P)/FAD-dependent oxidoreductase n=1 Tax=Qaidamihabitans albus TaxID=2795733 RepID=UPI0018F266C9|nr:FAD-dependent oxidoreductase [Qaidamihabitans albus]